MDIDLDIEGNIWLSKNLFRLIVQTSKRNVTQTTGDVGVLLLSCSVGSSIRLSRKQEIR